MTQPYTANNAIRASLFAIQNWLRGLRVDYGMIAGTARDNEPVLSIVASPTWAFSAIPDLLVERGWIAGATDADRRSNAQEFDRYPLPLITIEFQPPTPINDLDRPAVNLRGQFIDFDTGEYQNFPWPGHDDLEVTLTSWSRNRYTDNTIQEWIRSRLGLQGAGPKEVLIEVDHGDPFGVVLQPLRLNSVQDLSDLEGDDQRFIRTQFSFTFRHLTFRNESSRASPLESPITSFRSPSSAQSRLTMAQTDEIQACAPYVGRFSPNLFQYRPFDLSARRQWPILGTLPSGVIAPIEEADSRPRSTSRGAPTIRFALDPEQPGYRVNLFEWLAHRIMDEPVTGLDAAPRGVVSVSFDYSAHGDTRVQMLERDDPTVDLSGSVSGCACEIELPDTQGRWRRVHRLFLTGAKNLYGFWVGGGSAPSVLIHDPQIHHFMGVPSADTYVLPSDQSQTWVGLQDRSYLFVAPPPASGALGQIRWRNVRDAQSGQATIEMVKNYGQPSAVNAVFLGRPQQDAASVQVQTADPPPNLFAVPVDLPFRGDFRLQSDFDTFVDNP